MGFYAPDAPKPAYNLDQEQTDELVDSQIQDAKSSRRIGQQYLSLMRAQSDVANKWADKDRNFYNRNFRWREKNFADKALSYDQKWRQRREARQAGADVRQQFEINDGQRRRRMEARGVRPDAGAYQEADRKSQIAEGLAVSGAKNLARDRVEEKGLALQQQAINVGKGYAVNPATSMGLGNNAASSGFNGAMSGTRQASNINSGVLQGQQAAHNAAAGASAQATGSLFSGLGMLGGFALMSSSKDDKAKKRPARGLLGAVEKMPVEEWTYRQGVADEGRHIGPYAEDFRAATGRGDGRSIPVVDAIGVTMGAVKELSGKVDRLTAEHSTKPEAKSKKVAK